MMAGCLLAVLTYMPIYKAMQRAAGNNVATVKSARNKVTGAISLTPFTTDASGALVPAKEAQPGSYRTRSAGIHPGALRESLRRTLLSDDCGERDVYRGSLLLRETHGVRIWDEAQANQFAVERP
jgi:hypothetical protein